MLLLSIKMLSKLQTLAHSVHSLLCPQSSTAEKSSRSQGEMDGLGKGPFTLDVYILMEEGK